jgi:dTDP-4-amino-4,6-dideoxygalactose transaminase
MTANLSPGFADSLVIFGATPPPRDPMYVGRPNIPDIDQVLGRMRRALESRWLSNDGPMVREFETVIEARLGVRHCVAVTNATQGLGLVARALNWHGEVIVPAFTFVATAHAMEWHGLRAVLCEIDPVTHQIDPRAVEAAITPQTTGILAAHTWGQPCDIDALVEIASRHELDIVFDAAPAYGATYGGRPIGTFGRAEVFSFHATKIVNCGEGGAVVTDDDDLAARLRLMRTFGFADTDYVVSAGTNAKMSELAAAMGLCSMEHLGRYIDVNRENHAHYQRGLDAVAGISVMDAAFDTTINYNNVVLEIDSSRSGIDRDNLLRVLTAEGIFARRYFWPGVHRMEPYRSRQPSPAEQFPVSDAVARRVLSLPTGTSMQYADVERVCTLIADVVACSDEITGRLAVLDAGNA